MANTYTMRLAVKAEAGGIITHQLEKLLTGRTAIEPAVVHLRAGETSKLVEVAKPLPANASPAESYIVVATSQPGVKVRVGVNGTPSTCVQSGNLLTGTEAVLSQVQNGSTSPYFTQGGSWVDNQSGSASGYKACKWQASSTQEVTYGGDAWLIAPTTGLTQLIARYCFGVDDYVDMGATDDGKLIQLWLQTETKTNLTSCKVYFGCYPYGNNVDDDEVPAGQGETTDSTMAGDSIPGYYFSADVTSQVANNRWNLITLSKGDFTASHTAAYWGRITMFQVEWVYSVAPGTVVLGGSAVYFGDPPDAVVNSVAIIPKILSDRTGLCISLDAPANADADVLIMGGIS